MLGVKNQTLERGQNMPVHNECQYNGPQAWSEATACFGLNLLIVYARIVR
jgi:hypothetical protein